MKTTIDHKSLSPIDTSRKRRIEIGTCYLIKHILLIFISSSFLTRDLTRRESIGHFPLFLSPIVHLNHVHFILDYFSLFYTLNFHCEMFVNSACEWERNRELTLSETDLWTHRRENQIAKCAEEDFRFIERENDRISSCFVLMNDSFVSLKNEMSYFVDFSLKEGVV